MKIGTKLPITVTVELLKHMSEQGRFEQTLSEFPNLGLDDVRSTFAWLADQVERDVQREEEEDRKIVNQFVRRGGVSEQVKKVLHELTPKEGARLLRNFGALD